MENNNYNEAIALLENILKLEFPKDYFTFTEKNKEFLVRYSILKETQKTNDLLKKIKEDVTAYDTYMQKYPVVKNAATMLQEKRYERFRTLYQRDDKPFDNSFLEFLKWWYDNTDENGTRKCYYCGVEESVAEAAFNTGKISSKKFSGTLQIDRKDSEGTYSAKNCVFACVLCNNAKSDMISAEDFKKYFGKATKEFWEHLK